MGVWNSVQAPGGAAARRHMQHAESSWRQASRGLWTADCGSCCGKRHSRQQTQAY